MKFFLCLCFVLPFYCFSQDQTISKIKDEAGKSIKKNVEDTTDKTWKHEGLYGLNVSQGSLNNWAAGGDNFSLSVNSVFSLSFFYKKGKNSWDNSFESNFGYVKTTSLGSRKNDDRIDLLSKYGYSIGPKVNLAALFNFRSQLFKGYTYSDNVKTLSSAFLSPAYILLSPGFDFKPVKDLSIFVSPITSRWIIVKDDSLAARGLYGVDSNQHSKNEIGAFATINYIKDFNKVVSYKGRLDLLSNYKHNPQNIDVFMTNMLAVKLIKVLSVTWSVDLIYDDDVKLFGKNKNSAALQFKSLVGIGLLLKF